MASREAQPTDYRGRFKELQALELEARKDGLIEVGHVDYGITCLHVDDRDRSCSRGWMI
jgi:hypothetical protein